MVQLSLSFMRNSKLFSNHYLSHLVQRNREWREDEASERAFNRIKEIYDERGEKALQRLDEGLLEDFFIKKILEEGLRHHPGFQAKVEPSAKRPDYAFFPDKASLSDALDNYGKEDFYAGAIAVGDAKRWNVSLDKKLKGARPLEDRIPSFQIDTYLKETSKKWGILTNGRYWRLYNRETSYKPDSYYEIDLLQLLETNDVKNFKYFYLFFRLEAFLPGPDGKNFLDRVYEESVSYAQELGESLKENVYKAMKILAEGFFDTPKNNLTKTEENIKLVHDNTLKLLYRLLFIFYAESRGLLDTSNKAYEYFSLDWIRRDVSEKIDKKELILPISTVYWDRLKGLFDLINVGSESRKIPKDMLYIPPYNGGLFDPERNPFLKEKKIGDSFISKAIDLLARSEVKNGGGKGFVDYSTLDIRHLGSIYEGLLEYKLKVAEEELVAVTVKGKETWIPKETARNKIVDEVKPGELYLATDKGERKATGSYYTPDYIVRYIVENTVGPLVKEKLSENGGNPIDKILSIKVLDPAMGSGHFLVEATDFLAKALMGALGESPSGENEEDIKWARREVIRHCIYGVDLNPMAVELAKLSLWLSTVAVDKPLTFLDHRLKCGNSLIGTNLIDLPRHPEATERKKKREEKAELDERQKKFKEEVHKPFVDKIVQQMDTLVEISDDTLENIKRKEGLFKKLIETKEYQQIKAIADVYTAVYFADGIEKVPEKRYYDLFWAMKGDETEWKQKTNYKWFRDAVKIAEEKRFFHWELEFPEVFFEAGKEKENPGFDAVVGNPPYAPALKIDVSFFKKQFICAIGEIDLYKLFVEAAVNKTRSEGSFGMILSHTFLAGKNFMELRKFLLNSSLIRELIEYRPGVFPEVGISVCILLLTKKPTLISPRSKEIKVRLSQADPGGVDRKVSITEVPQDIFWTFPTFEFNTRLESFWANMWLHMSAIAVPLGELMKISRGIELGSNYPGITDSLCSTNVERLISGKDIERYLITWTGRGLRFDHSQPVAYKKHSLYEGSRILVQRLRTRATSLSARWIIATYTDESYLSLNTVRILQSPTETSDFNLRYLLALLNSRLLNELFRHIFSTIDVYAFQLAAFPIRRINFTTPSEERITLVESLQSKYNANQFDEILKIVEEYLPKDAEGKFITEQEKSDVVHDILAFLAEQMIKMGKEKQNLTQKFWTDLEGVVEEETFAKLQKGKQLSSLYKKSLAKTYVEENSHTTYGLDEALQWSSDAFKNFVKLLAGKVSNLSDILSVYEKHSDEVGGIAQRIEATDELIDQIVYKLYGLTEDEIKIVESSLSKVSQVVV
ncbi:MAG: N-6 DNA methylase [Methanocellales archaeon]|nr:N-6 DNA methylase [Methanocellales archaeon]MDD3292070.1 N-6 DNA methylase [Methanocellales archaeon]MDD5235549.1 N-6 DNA methylase [Methanocellales archaeon]MDD5485573.1 N-6 DNA methylase [Methanocellales archaeon]